MSPSLAPLLLVAAMVTAAPAAPDTPAPALASVFSDHMVLQRGVKHPVFGHARPGAIVTVHFGGQEKKNAAQADGSWRVDLDPLAANATGSDLTVEADGGTQALHDVLVGEVWLCAGQSNMAFSVADAAEAKTLLAAIPAGLRLYDPQPRLETNARPWPAEAAQTLKPGDYYAPATWTLADKSTVTRFSAVAFSFGRMLRDKLNVPVGLMDVAVGGTPTESWVPRAAVLADPLLAGLERDWPQGAPSQAFVTERVGQNLAAAVKAGAKSHDLEHPYRAGFMHSAAIAPRSSLPLAGVIWYQGESNAEDIGRHARLFPLLVQSLRDTFQNKDLPLYGVQLPGLDRPSWPAFREAQAQLLSGPHLGFAVTLDVGESHQVHPRRKQAVGERLARLALHDTYGQAIACAGPVPTRFAFETGVARVTFNTTPTLMPTPTHYASPFRVAGPDQVFFRATATMEGSTLLLASPKVPHPVAARYAWEPDPAATLFGEDNLPAAPFRSDDWPLAQRP